MKYLKKFSNTSDYEAFKGGGEYVTPNVSLITGDNSVMFNPIPPKLTTFYVSLNNTIYNFTITEGSTWEDFINSEYNTMNFYIKSDNIRYLHGGVGVAYFVCLENKYPLTGIVNVSDAIIDSYTYYLISPEPV